MHNVHLLPNMLYIPYWSSATTAGFQNGLRNAGRGVDFLLVA